MSLTCRVSFPVQALWPGNETTRCIETILHTMQAIEALEAFPSTATRDILRDAILSPNFYYCVKIQAAQSLAKVHPCVCVCMYMYVCMYVGMYVCILCMYFVHSC